MSTLQLFHILVAGHIATGLVGLLSFWVPIAARKGGPRHRWWGRVFVRSLLATGYGSECIKHRRAHALHRRWYNLLSQLLLLIAALLVVYQGWQARQPLMLGISMVGFATVGTNLYFMLNTSRD